MLSLSGRERNLRELLVALRSINELMYCPVHVHVHACMCTCTYTLS